MIKKKKRIKKRIHAFLLATLKKVRVATAAEALMKKPVELIRRKKQP